MTTLALAYQTVAAQARTAHAAYMVASSAESSAAYEAFLLADRAASAAYLAWSAADHGGDKGVRS